MRFSANLRIIYNLRSNSLLLVTSGPLPMRIWIIQGRIAAASLPTFVPSTGTSRQPRTTWPSSRTTSSKMRFCSLRRLSYLWANIIPTPYSPAAGKLIPSTSHSRLKNSCGICTKIPAPSPVSLSAPAPPRCSRRSKIRKPSSIISWDFLPLILTTKPMPHASFSNWLLYIPLASSLAWSRRCCSIVLWFLSITCTPSYHLINPSSAASFRSVLVKV